MSSRRSFLLLATIALLVRGAFLVAPTGVLWPDSPDYLAYGERIATAGNIIEHEPHRTIGYSLFVAFFFWLGGVTHLAGDAIIVTQLLLGVLTALLLFQLGRVVGYPRAGWWAGFLYALHPLPLYYENVPHTEALFAPLFVLFLIGVSTVELRRWLPSLVGFLGAMLVMVRPVAKIIVPITIVFLLMRRQWRAAALMGLTYGVALVPWLFINYLAFGVPKISLDTGLNLYHRVFDIDRRPNPSESEAPRVGQLREILRRGDRPTYFPVYFALRRETNARTTDTQMTQFAIDGIVEDPFGYLWRTVVIFVRYYAAPRHSIHLCTEEERRFACAPQFVHARHAAFSNRPDGAPPAVLALREFWLTATLYPYWLLLLAGLARAVLARGWRMHYLMVIALAFGAVTALVNNPEDRLAIPSYLILMLLAGVTAEVATQRLRQRPS